MRAPWITASKTSRPPAPTWPRTDLVSEVGTDGERPKYRYRRARWITYDDGVLLGMGHASEADDAQACAGVVRVSDLLQEATGASTAA